MPDPEVHTVKVTIDDIKYKNVKGAYGNRMGTLLYFTMPFDGKERNLCLQLYDALQLFSRGQEMRLHYTFENAAVVKTPWKKEPRLTFREIECGGTSVLLEQLIILK